MTVRVLGLTRAQTGFSVEKRQKVPTLNLNRCHHHSRLPTQDERLVNKAVFGFRTITQRMLIEISMMKLEVL